MDADLLQASDTIPGWLRPPRTARHRDVDGDFALLLTPLVLALAVALAVYVPRRPDIVGFGVVLFLLVPLFIAVLRRALDPDDNAGAGSLFYVLLPSVAIVVTASVYMELPRRVRVVAGTALAVCLLAGNVLLFTWMNDGEGLPVHDFAHLVTGKPLTTPAPPEIATGRWLEDNAVAGQVAVATTIPGRELKAIALMAGMPDLLGPAPRDPRWRVLPAGDPAPGGFARAYAEGDLQVVAQSIRPPYGWSRESSFPLLAARCHTASP